jgi:hypothetical protein
VIASSLTLRRRAPHEMKRSSLSNAELAARSRGSAFRLFEFRSVTAVWGGVAHSAFTMERRLWRGLRSSPRDPCGRASRPIATCAAVDSSRPVSAISGHSVAGLPALSPAFIASSGVSLSLTAT